MNCGKLLEYLLRCLCFDTISISLIDCFPYILAVYLTMLFFLGNGVGHENSFYTRISPIMFHFFANATILELEASRIRNWRNQGRLLE